MKDHPLMVQPTIADIAWLEPTMILIVGFCFGLLVGVVFLNRLKEKHLCEKKELLNLLTERVNSD